MLDIHCGQKINVIVKRGKILCIWPLNSQAEHGMYFMLKFLAGSTDCFDLCLLASSVSSLARMFSTSNYRSVYLSLRWISLLCVPGVKVVVTGVNLPRTLLKSLYFVFYLVQIWLPCDTGGRKQQGPVNLPVGGIHIRLALIWIQLE